MAQLQTDIAHSQPLFQQYPIETLTRLLGGLYSPVYLEHLDRGWQDCRPKFRATVSRILGRPESELFHPTAEAQS